jgi:hypothetical protein
MSDEQPDCQKKPGGVLVARGDFIAAAAVVSVLCGAFLPVPAWLLDIVWGCSLCLSTALVLISLTGREPLELSGFPPLMVFGALLRMGLSTATAGLVFRGRVGGTLIEATGDPIGGLGSIGVLLAMPVAAGVIALLVFRSAGRITAAALRCLTETIPGNESAIALDEQTGLIRPRRVQELKERTLGQTGFYLNMGGVARLLRCDAVIAAAVILTIIVGQLAVFTLHETMSEPSLRECAGAAAGAGVLTLLPMFAVAVASAHLTGRSCRYLKLPDEDGGRHRGEVIEIVSQETGQREQVELLNPDFVEVSEGPGPPGGVKENIAEFQPRDAVGAVEDAPAAGIHPAGDDPEAYYEELAAYVAGLGADKMPVLFAAQTSESLPVTVAVNVGIRLAQRGLRTLLVDADAGREAVAAVFDADIDGMRKGPVATCMEGLYVWGLRGIAQGGAPAVEPAIGQAGRDHDRLVVYAPDLMNQQHRTAVAAATASAVIFTNAGDEAGDLKAFLKEAGCGVIEQMPVLKADVE